MREIVHLQVGQCGNQIGSKVCTPHLFHFFCWIDSKIGYYTVQYGQYA